MPDETKLDSHDIETKERPHPWVSVAGASSSSLEPARGVRPARPGNIAPLVVWLGSAESADIAGRVFNMIGGEISVAEGWVAGHGADQKDRWDPAELGKVVLALVAKGWVEVRLDLGEEPDWEELAEIIVESYALIAPTRLVAQWERERSS
jgi:hypothetical protein